MHVEVWTHFNNTFEMSKCLYFMERIGIFFKFSMDPGNISPDNKNAEHWIFSKNNFHI